MFNKTYIENLKKRAHQLNKDVPAIFLALKHKDTPLLAKILAGITIAYALSPIDLIPDFIPVLGYLDDLILLPIFISITLKLIPHSVYIECLDKSDSLWLNGKPKKWFYALPIIIFWLVIFYFVLKLFIF